MSPDTRRALNLSANQIRIDLLRSIYLAQSGHLGGSLSIADLLAVLYDVMNVSPISINDPCRDRLVLSKGHAAPALYAALAQKGFFPSKWLDTLRTLHGPLQGHPDMHTTPGVDFSSGSLGLGLSVAVGMALGMRHLKCDGRVYCILGDGELQEGVVWEAASAASHYSLDRLTAFVDINGLQIDGPTCKVMYGGHEAARFEGFGWHTIHADGHDVVSIDLTLRQAWAVTGKPTVILLHTTKGKGVSFMENRAEWHGQPPSEAQYKQALTELTARRKELEEEK